MREKSKNRAIKEGGFLLIAMLLVLLSYMVAGSFFKVWINDYKLLSGMVLIFYLVIGFYRLLNHLARKYRDAPDN